MFTPIITVIIITVITNYYLLFDTGTMNLVTSLYDLYYYCYYHYHYYHDY